MGLIAFRDARHRLVAEPGDLEVTWPCPHCGVPPDARSHWWWWCPTIDAEGER